MALEAILRFHAAPKQIHYLSIDVEGSEYEILKAFPFDEYQFLAVTIEGRSCDDLLTNRGYEQVNCSLLRRRMGTLFVYRSD